MSSTPDSGSQPVTMRKVAEQAGVSIATVSLSLRDHPSIPLATRQRVQGIARQLGYRPDAYVSTLMARIHTRRPSTESPVLALVQEAEKAEQLARVPFYRDLYAGCVQRARELGYLIEPFLLEPGVAPGRRLHRVLSFRNVRGVIFGPLFRPGGKILMPLEGLASCALGDSVRKPEIHRISTHYAQAMRMAWTQLARHGYRRPGFIHYRAQLERINHALLSTILALQMIEPELAGVPPLILEESPDSPAATAACAAQYTHWAGEHRPDVLVFPPKRLVEAVGAPHPTAGGPGVILFDDEPGWTQVHQMPGHIGSGAVDSVVAQIHRNETGIPAFPQIISINCTWIEGDTLPFRK